MTSRRSLQIAAALAASGLVLALVLVRQHAQAYAGVASICNIDDFVNCDKVATSGYSVVAGLPLAAWGALFYGLVLLLSVAGLLRSRPTESWPAGILFVLGGAATATAMVLALLSELAIGALCLFCAGSWVASTGLFVAAWRATRPLGVLGALRADLAVLRARPGRTAGLVVAGGAVVAIVAAAYPRYWERRTPPPGQEKPAAQARAARAVPPAPAAGPTVIVEFSDYECPFCALAHEDLKRLLAVRPDVKLVKKHFPLDSACNPAVKRAMHPNACTYAAAAVCAEEQGRLAPMDDLLFENQKARRPLEELVRAAGLDEARFLDCMRAPSTLRRIEADVTAGLSVGIRATPTYVVNGVPFSGGTLTPENLPPAPAGVSPSVSQGR